jgi:alkylation response protein AidB-like acyl-CoA dehydrogenase
MPAAAAIERAVALTEDYTKQRKAFGQALADFQNTRFKLAECATLAHVVRSFVNDCIQRLLDGTLDDEAAYMAKWWCTEQQGKVVDECLQLFGGYGYMTEYPIARMFVDARVQRIYGGSTEIMKDLIARRLFGQTLADGPCGHGAADRWKPIGPSIHASRRHVGPPPGDCVTRATRHSNCGAFEWTGIATSS